MEHPEYTKAIDFAKKIRTSGRWDAVNAKIKRMATNPVAGEEWYVQVVSALLAQLFEEYAQLTRCYHENRADSISELAWRARNISELWVWSLYSTKSRENARCLYEDAGRDILNMSSAYIKNVEAMSEPSDLVQQLKLSNEDLRLRAGLEGISLEGSYKRVDDAADECGIRDQFSLYYKMASKFAHPTAMLILASPEELSKSDLREFFVGEGCLFFVEAFMALESAGLT